MDQRRDGFYMIKETPPMLDVLKTKAGQSHLQVKAWDTLSDIGLPNKKSESYKFTPIQSVLLKNIDWVSQGEFFFDKTKLYQEKGSHLVFSNGTFVQEYSTLNDLDVVVGQVTEGKHDPFSLLNAALANNEVTIKSGSELPVFIYHFNSSGISNPRIKVKVKSGDTCKIFEKIFPSKSNNTFTNSYIEFDIAPNAFGYHTKVQNYHDKAFTHETVFSKVSKSSHFYNNTFSFEGALVRNNLTIHLKDENCEGHMYGLFLLDKKSHIDNNTSVDHMEPNSFSNELYKGILDEKSTGVFNGKIYVRQNAQKTNAFQSNNNILLSEDATLHTKPQLEIWADDVKCSHGCTSGQLDEGAIFYLRARGINEKKAKAMILNAFATETMNHIHSKIVENEVKKLIDKKLS
ncbi:MAG: Fe-S cluster assembly protein SufD [Bacteroidota bacterium]